MWQSNQHPEVTGVTVAVPPSVAVQEFVQRLLNIERADRRRALIDRYAASAEELQDAVRRLLDEAVKLYGADPPRMERICADAAPLAERSGDEFLQAMVVMRQGDAARAQGRNTEACTLYDEAASVFTRLNRPVEAAGTRIGWMEATARLGHLSDALKAAGQARRVFQAHGEDALSAMLNVDAGVVHNEHGRHRQALRC
jgi:hypothetical protein